MMRRALLEARYKGKEKGSEKEGKGLGVLRDGVKVIRSGIVRHT